jgi:phosphate transport system protein
MRIDLAQELHEIDRKVTELFSLVSEGLSAATEALLSGDLDTASSVVARERLIDSLYYDIEGLVQRQFALAAPAATDMRYLLSMLRIVPELERSGDLVEHIANRALRSLGAELTPRIRGLVDRMGRVGVLLWRGAAESYSARDPSKVAELRNLDDELDELHVAVIAEIVEAELRLPIAIEMALVARFFERLGDHAVNVANRMRYVATGEHGPTH